MLRKSIYSTSFASLTSALVSLVLLLVVARILDAEQIGAFAIAYAIILFIQPLDEFKLIEFVQYVPDLDDRTMGSVNIMILLISSVSTLVMIAIALGMHWMDPGSQVAPLVAIGSAFFVINGISRPALAVLSRDMRFVPISVMRTLGVLAKIVVTLSLLAYEKSPMALIIGNLVEPAFLLFGLLIVDRKLAYARPRTGHLRHVFDYCTKTTAAAFLNRSLRASNDLVIGASIGLSAAGQFNRSNVLINSFNAIFMKSVAPVALTGFAQFNRSEREKLGQAYLKGSSMLSGVLCSVFGLIALVSEPLINVLFGAKWLAIIPYTQWLAIGGMLFAFSVLGRPALAAVGAANAILIRSALIQIPTFILMIAAAQFTLLSVCIVLALSRFIDIFVNLEAMRRYFGISAREFGAAAAPSIGVMVIMGLGAILAQQGLILLGAPHAVELLGTVFIAAAFWLLGVWLIHDALRAEVRSLTGYFTKKILRTKLSK